MDSARMSVVTIDEILTKLDIVLEEIIGCELEFIGSSTSSEIVAASFPSSKGLVVLTSTEVVKVDGRLAERMLADQSAYRVAFETVFKKALASSLDVDQETITVVSIHEVDGVRRDGAGVHGVSNLVKGALAAGRGNPALATAALATETTSRVAAWITGHGAAAPIAGSQPVGSRALAVRFSVAAAQQNKPVVVEKLQELATEHAQAVLSEHFKHTFRKGSMGKLNDLLERSDTLLQRLEPKIDPSFKEIVGTLHRINILLEQSNRILQKVEPGLSPFYEDVRLVLARLENFLDRSSRLLTWTEQGLDTAMQRGGGTLHQFDVFLGHAAGILKYIKFALLGIGICGFSIAFGILRVLTPLPLWGDSQPDEAKAKLHKFE